MDLSEYKFIIVLFISLFFLAMYFLNEKSKRAPKPQEFDGIGKITMINRDDGGYPWFYVDININGVVYSAQTDTYWSKPKGLRIGDFVSVRYCYIKGGDVRAYITQEGFNRIINENAKGKPVLLYISLAFFALFLILLVRHLLGG